MEKEAIIPANLPSWARKMSLPLSPAIKAGGFMFVSGSLVIEIARRKRCLRV